MCSDEYRLQWIVLNFLSQMTDVDEQCSDIADARPLPDCLVDLIKSNKAPRIAHKIVKEFILGRRKVQLAPILANSSNGGIHFKRTNAKNRVLCADRLCPPQVGLDAGNEDSRAERLYQIVISAHIQCSHNGFVIIDAADKDDGTVGDGSQLRTKVDPVNTGQLDIQQDKIKTAHLNEVACLFRAMGNRYVVFLFLHKIELKNLADFLIVFDEQNIDHR